MENKIDNVNNPNHYKLDCGVESIEIIKRVLGLKGFVAFCLGNILKYLIRAEKKNGKEDYKKAAKYLEWVIERDNHDKYAVIQIIDISNLEKEKVLEIEIQKVFDKIAIRIKYQNFEVLKRGEFEDKGIGVVSFNNPCYLPSPYNQLYLKEQERLEMIKHIVSFSGGKDSTAMLLMMLEKRLEIDDIVFTDTGVEFPEMYEHIEKVEQYINRKITKLKTNETFEFMLLNYEKKKGKNKGQKGYSFPDFRNRWCTKYFKQRVIKKYLKEKYKGFEIVEYHGIAIDEPKRLEKNKNKNIKYPLAEWGITEQEALEYCYSKGFSWNGLYKKFHRVSCWCCPLKSLRELKVLYKEYPEYFKKLEEWESKTYRKFRADYSIKELRARFTIEIGGEE